MSYAQDIRDYARKRYIEPALQRGDRKIQIRAGDVHKAMRFENRPAMVCQALASKIFLNENNLALESKEGPPSGLSTSMVYTYRIGKEQQLLTNASQPSAQGRYKNPALLELLKLKGIGKELFASLGGGENFLRSEREALNESLLKRERERGVL
jgi:hypothetical protein